MKEGPREEGIEKASCFRRFRAGMIRRRSDGQQK
jgi:hypothetical protein